MIKELLKKAHDFGFKIAVDSPDLIRLEKLVKHTDGYAYGVVLAISTVKSNLPRMQRELVVAKFYGPGAARFKGTSTKNIVYGTWKTVDGACKGLNSLSWSNFIKK